MDSTYLTNPLVFLVQVLLGFYTIIVLLRFLLQLFRADFYNPLSQFIVKVTTPVLKPLRSIIPGYGGLDLSSLVVAWLVKTLELFLVLWISGKGLLIAYPMLMAIPGLVELIINIFLFAILITVIISWISPGGYNPAVNLLYSLTDPLMKPARKLISPIGGIDLSPMLVMIGLAVLKMLLIPLIQQMMLMIIQG